MSKLTFILPITLLVSTYSFAEQNDEIDPADLTNIYSQAAIMFSGSSDVMLQGQVSGGYQSGQQFAFLAESTFVDESKNSERDRNDFGTDYSHSRFQYFHVFEPNSKLTPRLGLSFDYINTRNDVKSDLLSIGGIAAINPAYTGGVMVFPRVGLLTGSMEVPSLMTEKDDLLGYTASLFIVQRIGENGAYVNFTPDWQDASGDYIEMQSMSYTVALSVPLTNDRSWWLNTQYEVSKSDIRINNIELESSWETEAWIGVRRYF